jgi:hypothetical protein
VRTDRGYYLISSGSKPASVQQEKVTRWLLNEAWNFHHISSDQSGLLPKFE